MMQKPDGEQALWMWVHSAPDRFHHKPPRNAVNQNRRADKFSMRNAPRSARIDQINRHCSPLLTTPCDALPGAKSKS
jgi:hypothetical protein